MFQKKKKKAVRDYKYILRVANQKKKICKLDCHGWLK